MIIVEEFTNPTIKMYLRDFTTESFEIEIISESDKEDIYEDISGTYDSFRKTLSFSYDTSVLYPENLLYNRGMGGWEGQATFTG